MQHFYRFFFIILTGFLFIFAGCDTSNVPNIEEGVFIDSPVQGLSYDTLTQSGITGEEGKFIYEQGEIVTFYIGDIFLGQAKGKSVITPIDLVAGAEDLSNSTVINICRFLQSLDQDGDLDNGIMIPEQVRDVVKGKHINFNQSSEAFGQDCNVAGIFIELNALSMFENGTRSLLPVDQVISHMKETLKDIDGSEGESEQGSSGDGGSGDSGDSGSGGG